MHEGASDPYFDVTVDVTAIPASITASGELDAASSIQLRRAIDEALEAGSGVTLDLGKVTFIDSSALRVVTVAVRTAREQDQPFSVIDASDAVRRIFEITGVSSLLAP